MNAESRLTTQDATNDQRANYSQSIEWYSEGQTRVVEVGGMQITIRFVARKGRRARIAISAPAGAVFRAAEGENFVFVE